MSKTYLVARRELVENMRTKTFWLGILIAPIGIVVFYAVMFLLAGATAKREYVVLDQSKGAWFSQAISEKAKEADIKDWVRAFPDGHPFKQAISIIEEVGGKPIWDMGLADAVGLQEKLAASDKMRLLRDEIQQDAEKQKLLQDSMQQFIDRLKSKDNSDSFKQVAFKPEGEDSEKILDQKLTDGELFAYFVITNPTANKTESKYVSNNVTDFKLRTWYEGLATDVLRERNIGSLKKEKGLSDRDVAGIRARFSFDRKSVSATGQQKKVTDADAAFKYAPLVFVYILWLSVFMAAQMLLTNTVEEKSNRIIEVLLSSVSPSQLMHGKIFGIAATGMVIVGSWALFAYAGVKLAPSVVPSSGATITNLGLDAILGDPVYLGSFLAYFLAGYLIFASILVALGSVCNSLKEAQNLQQPVVFLLIVPMLTMLPIVWDPNGAIARVMTYIPLYTPFAMMNRAGGPPPTWEYIASSALILATLWIGFKGAAKIFRVGVLMTGKPPRIGEILRWLRAPVN